MLTIVISDIGLYPLYLKSTTTTTMVVEISYWWNI